MTTEREAVLEQEEAVLATSRMVSLIVYVRDLAASRSFYEKRLGLRVVDEDEDSVAYDAGPSLLRLERADDYGIDLPATRDDASDVVFLVEDVEGTSAALLQRGVQFERQRTYGVGTVVDFYDPDGHRLMLYEPSEHAMTTPAADTIRAVWRASGRGGEGLIGPPAGPAPADESARGLDGKPLIYCFVFVPDILATNAFYEDDLGLPVLDRSHCCNDACPDDEKGVVKYEGGGVILSSHHMHGHEAVLDDHGQPYGAREYEPASAKGVAPVYEVDDIDSAYGALADAGLEPHDGRILRSARGAMLGVDAPSGHLLYLYEPSPEARAHPSFEKLRDVADAIRAERTDL